MFDTDLKTEYVRYWILKLRKIKFILCWTLNIWKNFSFVRQHDRGRPNESNNSPEASFGRQKRMRSVHSELIFRKNNTDIYQLSFLFCFMCIFLQPKLRSYAVYKRNNMFVFFFLSNSLSSGSPIPPFFHHGQPQHCRVSLLR